MLVGASSGTISTDTRGNVVPCPFSRKGVQPGFAAVAVDTSAVFTWTAPHKSQRRVVTAGVTFGVTCSTNKAVLVHEAVVKATASTLDEFAGNKKQAEEAHQRTLKQIEAKRKREEDEKATNAAAEAQV